MTKVIGKGEGVNFPLPSFIFSDMMDIWSFLRI
jgi:hypothetical protein